MTFLVVNNACLFASDATVAPATRSTPTVLPFDTADKDSVSPKLAPLTVEEQCRIIEAIGLKERITSYHADVTGWGSLIMRPVGANSGVHEQYVDGLVCFSGFYSPDHMVVFCSLLSCRWCRIFLYKLWNACFALVEKISAEDTVKKPETSLLWRQFENMLMVWEGVGLKYYLAEKDPKVTEEFIGMHNALVLWAYARNNQILGARHGDEEGIDL